MKRIIFLSLVLAVWTLPAAAHGTSLSLRPSQVQPGDRLAVEGAGLGENPVIQLTLEGALNTYPLGEAQGNAHGEFQAEVLIPAEVKPGSYTVVAQAGTTTVSAPLRVAKRDVLRGDAEKPGTTLQEQESTGAEHGAKERSEEHASLEPLQLDRSWSPSETTTAWGLILLAALVGGLLWFKR